MGLLLFHFTEVDVGSLEGVSDVPATTVLDDGRNRGHCWVNPTSMPDLKKLGSASPVKSLEHGTKMFERCQADIPTSIVLWV